SLSHRSAKPFRTPPALHGNVQVKNEFEERQMKPLVQKERSLPGVLQDFVHLGPQRPAGPLLVLGERLPSLLVTDAGGGEIILARPEGGALLGLDLGLTGLGLLRPVRQVGLEPVEGLLPPVGLVLLIQRWLVIALPSSRESRSAGGVVAVTGPRVLGQLGL